MLQRLQIKNFKSIEDVSLDLPLVTLLIGRNSSGKSSILQTLAVLKNFFLNTNRPLDELFNLGYIRLGTYNDVVSQHQSSENITIKVKIGDEKFEEELTIELGTRCSSELSILKPFQAKTRVEFAIPYSQNQQAKVPFKLGDLAGNLVWNGLSLSLEPGELSNNPELRNLILLHWNTTLSVFMIPLINAFTNNLYTVVGIPDKKTILTIPENVLVSIFQQEPDLEEQVSNYMETIFEVRSVRPRIVTYPNLSMVVGRKLFVSNIVNEGFGLNRTAYILATLLTTARGSAISLEEPEIHLHPEAQSRLATVLASIVKDMDRQLVISTHSEHLLLGFLSAISKGLLTPKDIAIYYTELDSSHMRTTVERAEINDKGQVKGGLKGFFDADIDALSEAMLDLGSVKNGNSG